MYLIFQPKATRQQDDVDIDIDNEVDFDLALLGEVGKSIPQGCQSSEGTSKRTA